MFFFLVIHEIILSCASELVLPTFSDSTGLLAHYLQELRHALKPPAHNSSADAAGGLELSRELVTFL